MIIDKCTDYTGAEKPHALTCEVIGRTKTKIYLQGAIRQRCVLAALRTIKWVWLKLEIKQNHWTILKRKKAVFHTSLVQMFKCMTTKLSVQLTTQQRLMCVLKNARLLPDCCCFLSDKGNEILFRINISLPLTMIAGLDRAGQCLGLPGHQTSHQWTYYGTTLKPWFTHCQLILKRIVLPVLLRKQQPSSSNLAFLSTCQSVLCHCTPGIEVGDHTFEHTL